MRQLLNTLYVTTEGAYLNLDHETLKVDSFIPATMAAIYLCLFIYFKAIGGYKAIRIDPEEITGGVPGPMQA